MYIDWKSKVLLIVKSVLESRTFLQTIYFSILQFYSHILCPWIAMNWACNSPKYLSVLFAALRLFPFWLVSSIWRLLSIRTINPLFAVYKFLMFYSYLEMKWNAMYWKREYFNVLTIFETLFNKIERQIGYSIKVCLLNWD